MFKFLLCITLLVSNFIFAQNKVDHKMKIYNGHHLISLNSGGLVIADTSSQYSKRIDLIDYKETTFCCPESMRHYSNDRLIILPNEEDENGVSFSIIQDGNVSKTKTLEYNDEFDIYPYNAILTDDDFIYTAIVNQAEGQTIGYAYYDIQKEEWQTTLVNEIIVKPNTYSESFSFMDENKNIWFPTSSGLVRISDKSTYEYISFSDLHFYKNLGDNFAIYSIIEDDTYLHFVSYNSKNISIKKNASTLTKENFYLTALHPKKEYEAGITRFKDQFGNDWSINGLGIGELIYLMGNPKKTIDASFLGSDSNGKVIASPMNLTFGEHKLKQYEDFVYVIGTSYYSPNPYDYVWGEEYHGLCYNYSYKMPYFYLFIEGIKENSDFFNSNNFHLIRYSAQGWEQVGLPEDFSSDPSDIISVNHIEGSGLWVNTTGAVWLFDHEKQWSKINSDQLTFSPQQIIQIAKNRILLIGDNDLAILEL